MSALVKCKACGKDVAKTAKACPNCGAPPPSGLSTVTKAVIGVGLAFLGLVCVAAVGRRAEQVSTPVHTAPVPVAPPPTRATAVAAGGQAVAVSEARALLEFGKPTVKNEYGMVKVMVEARNTTDRQISCMLTATFKQGDTILGTAGGAVNEVPAGGTRTAEMIGMSPMKGYDTVKLEASTCF